MNYIGFTAHHSGNMGLSGGQTAAFDTALTNVGGGYDTNTGIFTCPTSGLYFFGVATYTGPDTYTALKLIKENSGDLGSFGDSEVSEDQSGLYHVGRSVP